MNTSEMTKAGIAILVAGGLLKFGNENYELLKADYGMLAPLACLIGGGALLYYGIKSFRRAMAG